MNSLQETARNFAALWVNNTYPLTAPTRGKCIDQLWGALKHGPQCNWMSLSCSCLDEAYIKEWIRYAAMEAQEQILALLPKLNSRLQDGERERLLDELEACRKILKSYQEG